ncbi:hypothetical protein [Streptomyces caelestis]|uniref:hypothetical protein n=1 Tax=Streptomyces caelestis TaxID=36816 RepID=UPI00365499C9
MLSLSPAGGTLTHRTSEEGTIDLDDGLPQNREVFSTEAGEAYGTNSGERRFLTGAVGVLPADGPQVAGHPREVLLDPHGGPAHPHQPLGGGITDVVTDSGVVVELPCAGGEADGRPSPPCGRGPSRWPPSRPSRRTAGSPTTTGTSSPRPP